MFADAEFTAFLRDQVRSVWGVELLLTMKREPERCWEPSELVRELRASTSLVRDILQRFERSGLVVRDERSCYRYRPAATLLADLCERLQDAYRERPVSVINLIVQPPDPLQSLAAAFRLRRGDDK